MPVFLAFELIDSIDPSGIRFQRIIDTRLAIYPPVGYMYVTCIMFRDYRLSCRVSELLDWLVVFLLSFSSINFSICTELVSQHQEKSSVVNDVASLRAKDSSIGINLIRKSIRFLSFVAFCIPRLVSHLLRLQSSRQLSDAGQLVFNYHLITRVGCLRDNWSEGACWVRKSFGSNYGRPMKFQANPSSRYCSN